MPDGANIEDVSLPFLDVYFVTPRHKAEGWYRVFRGGTVVRWLQTKSGRWTTRYCNSVAPYAVRARKIAAAKGYETRKP